MHLQFNGIRMDRWGQKGSYGLSALLVLLFMLGPSSKLARAASPVVVGDGTPESCTSTAFYQALAGLPAGGTIAFNCGPNPVTVWVDELAIEKDLTIDGGGRVTFTGGDELGDMFGIHGGVNVQFMNLTISDGVGACSGPIYNHGTLILQHVTMINNHGGHGCGSGAIFSDTNLTIEDSTISGNYGGCDPVQCGPGGGIGNAGNMRIVNSTISGNSALGAGGGIDNSGTATIIGSTISGNSSLCGTLPWDENEVCFPGGGIRNTGTLNLINSTLSGNSAGDIGGAIDNSGTLFLQNTTIADNTAKVTGGVANDNIATLQNTIVAGNTDASQQPSDCSGTLASQGYNLIQSLNGCIIAGDATGNLVNVDAMLNPLQDNGGSTFTQAPLQGSPGVDAGSPGPAGSSTACEASDQRGIARPQGAGCDIGAVEVDPSSLAVQMDIRPGNLMNRINLRSKGVIPLAILSTATFDATAVDPTSVKLGPKQAQSLSSSLVDINHDGRLDLLLHIREQQTGLKAGDTQLCLAGQTLDGTALQGCDMISIVP